MGPREGDRGGLGRTQHNETASGSTLDPLQATFGAPLSWHLHFLNIYLFGCAGS